MELLESLEGLSSSSGNVRSFHRESVLLRLDHDQRRYCYRWHEDSASFWLRRKPHRRRFDEALYRSPKQWFRKVRAVDATGVGRWVLKPLLTDQNRICCRRCCSEGMASITVVDEDSSGSSQVKLNHSLTRSSLSSLSSSPPISSFISSFCSISSSSSSSPSSVYNIHLPLSRPRTCTTHASA